MSEGRKRRFRRQESWRLKRVRDAWRRPKGVTSRMRKEKAGWPRRVRAGFGSPSGSRGLHPSGLKERIVEKISDLDRLDSKLDIVRFSARLGERKRLAMLEKAREYGLRVANPRREGVPRTEGTEAIGEPETAAGKEVASEMVEEDSQTRQPSDSEETAP